MTAPWQCPECRIWLAPGTQTHSCFGVNPNGTELARSVAHDSEVLNNPSTKRRRPYNEDYEPGFLTFWNIYPRHRDKRKAQKAWRNAMLRTTPEAINAGAKRYRYDPSRVEAFTKYAEGWLNGDGWLDEPLPQRLGRGIEPARPQPSPEEIEAEVAEFIGEGYREAES